MASDAPRSFSYRPLPHRPTTKGKGKAKAPNDAELEEIQFSIKLQDNAMEDYPSAADPNEQEQEYEDIRDAIECGCCFANHPFVRTPFLVFLDLLILFWTGKNDSMSRSSPLLHFLHVHVR